MPEKESHEDSAIAALCDELAARGRQVRLLGNPDRDRGRSNTRLTVDALIEIDGTAWAVDHCLVSRPPELPAAMRYAGKALWKPLEELAGSTHTGMAVQYQPQVDAYYAEVLRLAGQACKTGKPVSDFKRGILIQGWPDEQSRVTLQAVADLTGSIFLGSQIEAGLADALGRKLADAQGRKSAGQLKRAKEAGYPVALLLDQVPRPGVHSATIRIASPARIAKVVQRILNEHPGVVDQVWLQSSETVPAFVAPHVHLLIAN
jgi:hypothetical protein